MAELRDVLTAAGFARVRTYIQSGNVLVDTDSPPPVVAQRISLLIKRHIGPDLKVMVRTCDEIKAVLRADPFRDYDNAASCTYVVHFDEQPSDAATQAVATQEYGRDKIVFDGRTAYLYIPGTYGQSKLSGANLEKSLVLRRQCAISIQCKSLSRWLVTPNQVPRHRPDEQRAHEHKGRQPSFLTM